MGGGSGCCSGADSESPGVADMTDRTKRAKA